MLKARIQLSPVKVMMLQAEREKSENRIRPTWKREGCDDTVEDGGDIWIGVLMRNDLFSRYQGNVYLRTHKFR